MEKLNKNFERRFIKTILLYSEAGFEPGYSDHEQDLNPPATPIKAAIKSSKDTMDWNESHLSSIGSH